MIDQRSVRNRLLRRVPEQSFDFLAAHLRPVELPAKKSLVQPSRPIKHVCFIKSGLASVVAESPDRKSIEIRPVGREGLAGYPVVLGVDRTPNRTFMQVRGRGLQIATEPFLQVLDDTATRLLLLRYVHTCELQFAYTALAAAKCSLHQRLARWVLMCHDRLEADDLPLTHDLLGMMLGVRRSGVTEQLHMLEGIRAIKSTRGNIRVLDRAMLIDIAGGCYGVPEQEYERLMAGVRPSLLRPAPKPERPFTCAPAR